MQSIYTRVKSTEFFSSQSLTIVKNNFLLNVHEYIPVFFVQTKNVKFSLTHKNIFVVL